MRLLVVTSLIATMAFQAALTPPGGLWQDNKPQKYEDDRDWHHAGEAVMAYADLVYLSISTQ